MQYVNNESYVNVQFNVKSLKNTVLRAKISK